MFHPVKYVCLLQSATSHHWRCHWTSEMKTIFLKSYYLKQQYTIYVINSIPNIKNKALVTEQRQ